METIRSPFFSIVKHFEFLDVGVLFLGLISYGSCYSILQKVLK